MKIHAPDECGFFRKKAFCMEIVSFKYVCLEPAKIEIFPVYNRYINVMAYFFK